MPAVSALVMLMSMCNQEGTISSPATSDAAVALKHLKYNLALQPIVRFMA